MIIDFSCLVSVRRLENFCYILEQFGTRNLHVNPLIAVDNVNFVRRGYTHSTHSLYSSINFAKGCYNVL
jgi:hypothetical protein